jgi:hypothetical protein
VPSSIGHHVPSPSTPGPPELLKASETRQGAGVKVKIHFRRRAVCSNLQQVGRSVHCLAWCGARHCLCRHRAGPQLEVDAGWTLGQCRVRSALAYQPPSARRHHVCHGTSLVSLCDDQVEFSVRSPLDRLVLLTL